LRPSPILTLLNVYRRVWLCLLPLATPNASKAQACPDQPERTPLNEDDYKAGLAQRLLRDSPVIKEWVDSHPIDQKPSVRWGSVLAVGEDEILFDDARRYADLVAKSGSAAELHVWQGMVHVFPANVALLQAAREALDITGEFLRSNLGR